MCDMSFHIKSEISRAKGTRKEPEPGEIMLLLYLGGLK